MIAPAPAPSAPPPSAPFSRAVRPPDAQAESPIMEQSVKTASFFEFMVDILPY
jgi:hypothetical protein